MGWKCFHLEVVSKRLGEDGLDDLMIGGIGGMKVTDGLQDMGDATGGFFFVKLDVGVEHAA